jgi:hypothetical protein
MYNPIACLVHAYVKKRPVLLRPLRSFVDISYAVDNADVARTVATADLPPRRLYNVSSNIHVTGH